LGLVVTILVEIGVAAAPAAVGASPASISSYGGGDPRDPRGALLITGRGSDHEIAVRFDRAAREYVISDTAGVAPFGESCRSVDATRARCDLLGAEVVVSLGAGDDDVTLDASVRQVSELSGGPGDDALAAGGHGRARLQGGGGNDRLLGGRADDRLRAGDGDDFLDGRQGADRFAASGGRDFVLGSDGEPDAAVKCGTGRDLAELDPRHDPRPRGCEVVRR
jgi:hypothetical protein